MVFVIRGALYANLRCVDHDDHIRMKRQIELTLWTLHGHRAIRLFHFDPFRDRDRQPSNTRHRFSLLPDQRQNFAAHTLITGGAVGEHSGGSGQDRHAETITYAGDVLLPHVVPAART